MAKPTFSKLKLQLKKEAVPVQFGEQTIAVKQYLPIKDKLTLIGDVIGYAHDFNSNYNNPVKTEMLFHLELIYAYTDLTFTKTQQEEVFKTYDLLKSSGLLDMILNVIPKDEYDTLYEGLNKTITSIYAYRNSALGILDNINQDAESSGQGFQALQDALANPENFELLTQILSKLG